MLGYYLFELERKHPMNTLYVKMTQGAMRRLIILGSTRTPSTNKKSSKKS